MQCWNNTFFLAFLSIIGWLLALIFLRNKNIGKNSLLGILVVSIVEIPRIILPLPSISQPRFENGNILVITGFVILIISLIFGMAACFVKPFTKPNKEEKLQTTGFYSIVRHPVMFCDSFWPLGLSLIFKSIYGTVFTLIWFIGAYLVTLVEEKELIEEYGDAYIRYRKKVPRIIPFLKFL
jgi:protein-S-isoprenylcysteine O-methyltransferase Ste14